jgi:hypothetical protein
LSAVAHAALAIALLAGGSGEPDPKSNFFLQDLGDLRQALIARGWQVSVVAGQGSSKPKSKAASNAELSAETVRVLKQAGAGDRVLLLFHSHGMRQRADWGQKSHSITSEDVDSSGSEPGFDLDRVEPALKDAAARGVRTALVDMSCYSGATLALQGPVCTVTLASRKYISLCSGRPEEDHFASRFFKLPAQGTKISLEAQFLQARRADTDSINLPQISSRKTPALEGWDDFLEMVDPLDIFEDLEELRTGAKPFKAAKLLDQIKDPPKGTAEKLKETLETRSKLERAMPALADDYDKEELAFDLPTGEKLKLAPASLADLLDAAAESKPQTEDWDDVQRHRLEQVRPARAAIAERFHAQLEGFRKRRKEFDRLTTELQNDADSLMSSERRLYDERSEPIPGQDGCKDFFL